MIQVELKGAVELTASLEQMSDRMKLAIAEKMTALTAQLEAKVVGNLEGKVLQKQTGQMVSRVKSRVESSGEVVTGFVGMEPATKSDWAHEFGGKGNYEILPTKANILRFLTKSGEEVFTKRVDHPPAQERSYLRSALAEMLGPVQVELLETIQSVIDQSVGGH